MSTNRSRRIDRDTAEQLLGGAGVGTSAGQGRLTEQAALAGLLAAAAAPAVDGELPGERAALAAFREARRNPAPQTGRRTMDSTALARAFSVKVLAVAFASTALGGVALAATGNLPGLGHPSTRPTNSAQAHPGQGSPGPDRSGGPVTASGSAGRTTGSPHAPGQSPEPGSTLSPNPGLDQGGALPPDLARLCQSYLAQATGAVLADPSFAKLVKAAGGVDKVDGYCANAGKDKPGSPDPSAPSDPHGNNPTKLPTDLPSKPDHSGKPSNTPDPHNTKH